MIIIMIVRTMLLLTHVDDTTTNATKHNTKYDTSNNTNRATTDHNMNATANAIYYYC